MQEERTEPTRPSWRRKSAAVPRPQPKGREWKWTERRAKPSGEVKLPRSRTFKVAGALLGFFACLTALVVLIILFRPPSSVALVLVGADYADNLMIPHNILGWKGIEAIDALARTPPPW